MPHYAVLDNIAICVARTIEAERRCEFCQINADGRCEHRTVSDRCHSKQALHLLTDKLEKLMSELLELRDEAAERIKQQPLTEV